MISEGRGRAKGGCRPEERKVEGGRRKGKWLGRVVLLSWPLMLLFALSLVNVDVRALTIGLLLARAYARHIVCMLAHVIFCV